MVSVENSLVHNRKYARFAIKGNYTEGLSAESNARLPLAGDPACGGALAAMRGAEFWLRG
jgi:hypothetical protein